MFGLSAGQATTQKKQVPESPFSQILKLAYGLSAGQVVTQVPCSFGLAAGQDATQVFSWSMISLSAGQAATQVNWSMNDLSGGQAATHMPWSRFGLSVGQSYAIQSNSKPVPMVGFIYTFLFSSAFMFQCRNFSSSFLKLDDYEVL